MQAFDKLIYQVGEIEIDPARNGVRRAGAEWTLRQKSFQVLLYLLEHRARLVTKDELLERLWADTAVTDDALVQTIGELRRTLGDDARHPRFIRTVPKAGYQFIGPVSELRAAPLVEIEEITTVQIELAREAGGTGSVSDLMIHSRAHQESPARYRSPYLIGVVALGLFVALAAGWYFWRRPSVLPAAAVTLPHVPGKQPVAVMYFENRAADRELDWLREGLADMLIASLSRSQRLTLLSRQQLAALLSHTGQANAAALKLEDGLAIAQRAQAETMILGGFARLGDKVRIDVTLHDARTGQLQAAESLVADTPAQILTQIDLLSLKLAQHLGAALPEADAQRSLAATMTNNLDAYRYYSLALEQSRMFQLHEAIALLEKALALDANFAMAHARIGYVYAVRMGQGERATPHLAKALALADRLSEKDRWFITAWQATAARNPARAIEVYSELTARYPLETEAYLRLNYALQTQNRFEEALAVIRQGLLTDPEAQDLHSHLGAVYLRLGRYEESQAAYQLLLQLAPNNPSAWDSLGLLHQWRGQYAEAKAAYNRALALNPESGVAIIHLGNLRFQQGRYRAAIEQYRRYIQIARDDDVRARGWNCLAWVYAKRNDTAQAAAAAREQMRYNPALGWNTLVLALERREAVAVTKLGESFFTTANYDLLNERGSLRIWEYLHGVTALREGRTDEALNRFRAALKHRAVEWNIDSFEDCLANALLELGRHDEAMAEYERILKINPNYPLAHYRLGQVYERKAERERARAAYERFLQVWNDADADVPEVAQAQERLAISR